MTYVVEKKCQSIETVSECLDIEFSAKDLKVPVINIFKQVKEIMLEVLKENMATMTHK